MFSAADLTLRGRIREAAIARFPRDGFAGTTLRAIAEDVSASPALIVHHFGSKAGLQAACDRHVLEVMAEQKRRGLAAGTHRSPDAIADAYQLAAPLVRYLAWTLRTGSEAAARLFDALVDDVTAQLAEGQEAGHVRPFDGDPRVQAAVLVTFQLGGLILHEHLSRAVGLDALTPEGLLATAPYSLRVISGALFDQDLMAETARALDQAGGPTDRLRPDPGPDPGWVDPDCEE